MPSTDVAKFVLPDSTGTEIERASLNELETIRYQAEIMARSTLVPPEYRGKPANIFLAWAEGRKFGFDVTTAMANIHVIKGKATMSANAQLGVIRKFGHLVKIDGDHESCSVTGTRTNTGETHTTTFTLEDAKRAGLLTGPNSHSWQHYPRAMLRSRAVTELGRVLFSDVLLGMNYAPDEIPGTEIVLDDDGDMAPVPADAIPRRSGHQAAAALKQTRNEAKRAVLKLCDGDRDYAARIWRKVVDDDNDVTQLGLAPEWAKEWLESQVEAAVEEIAVEAEVVEEPAPFSVEDVGPDQDTVYGEDDPNRPF